VRDKRSWSHTRSLALARAAEKEEGSFGFIREMVFLSAFLCDSVRDKRSWSHTRSLALARVTEEEEGVLGFTTNQTLLSVSSLPAPP